MSVTTSAQTKKIDNEKTKQPQIEMETYPADCRKIAAIDSNKHGWD